MFIFSHYLFECSQLSDWNSGGSMGTPNNIPQFLGAILVLVLVVSLCMCRSTLRCYLRQILRLPGVLSFALASVSLTGNFLDFQFHPSTQRDEEATFQSSLCCWNWWINQGSPWLRFVFWISLMFLSMPGIELLEIIMADTLFIPLQEER